MAGAPLPSFSSVTKTSRRFLITDTLDVAGPDVVVDSGEADSTTPTSWLRPGTVLVKRTSTGKYIGADDSNADTFTQATVTSLEAADTDWDGTTVTIKINGITITTVVFAGSDDTTAECVTALNANAIFAANCIASGSNGNPVVIKALRPGADTTLTISSDLATAWGASGTSATGTDPDVVVTTDWVALTDEFATAVDGVVSTLRVGHFDESELIVSGTAGSIRTMAPVAYAVLAKRGSVFE